MNESKHQVIAIIVAILGFTLIYLEAILNASFFLASIGVWILMGVYVYDIRRRQKEARKENKEIIL
jgi:membrane protein implicated in regulation of membrane protease activity